MNALRSILAGATEEEDIERGSEPSEDEDEDEDMALETASFREAHETAE